MLSYNIAPLFLEGGGFHSSIAVVNSIGRTEKIVMWVRRNDGFVLAQKDLVIEAHSQQRFSISDLIGLRGNRRIGGSVILFPTDEGGMTVAAQLSITYGTGQSTSFIDEEFVMPAWHDSPILRGVGSKTITYPLLAIASLSSNAQIVNVQCISDDQALNVSYPISLGPNKTVLVRACDRRDSEAIETNLLTNETNSKQRIVAISLKSQGTAGTFAAYGIGAYKRRNSSSLNMRPALIGIPFSDPAKAFSSNMVFTGVPVGALDSTERFKPSVTIANFGTKPTDVRIRYAPSSESAATKVLDVARATIKPSEVQLFDFDNLPASPAIGSIVVETNGTPGDVVSNLTSFADKTNSHLSIEGHDANAIENGGKHPWTIDHAPGSDAALILFNHGTTSEAFSVQVSGKDARWAKRYDVPSMQTLTVSLRQLIDKQIKDDRGAVLPASLTSGAVTWYASKRGIGKGRLYETSSSPIKKRSFSCGGVITMCNYGAGLYFGAGLTLDIGGSGQIGEAYGEQCQTEDGYTGNPCGQFDMGMTYNNFSATWTGCNHISGCGVGDTWNTNQAIFPTGLSAGADNLQFELHDLSNYQCYAYGWTTATVTSCPARSDLVSNTQIDPLVLGGGNPPIISAAGSLSIMHVGDTSNSTNFDGQAINESVSIVESTCPINPCVASTSPASPFIVGQDQSGYLYAPPIHNSFYDYHVMSSTSNLLADWGMTACATKCSQVYTCVGSQTTMGAYTLYYHFAQGTVNGQPGTIITVDKY